MKLDQIEYYHRRAVQEQVAARKATSLIARQKHHELAAMYRLRTMMLTSSPELWVDDKIAPQPVLVA